MYPTIMIYGKYISIYGLMVIVAFTSLYIISVFLSKQRNLDKIHTSRMAIYTIFGALVGSKLLFFITDGLGNLKWLLANTPNASIWMMTAGLFGGFRFLGGVVLALVMLWWYTKLAGIDFYTYTPVVTVPVSLALAFYRLGCFFAGCCYGRHTDSIYGVHFPGMAEGVRVVPLQLVEGGIYFVFFIIQMILWHVHVHERIHHHIVIMVFALTRFITDYFREDASWLFPFLSVTQLLCLLALIYVIVLEVVYRKTTSTNIANKLHNKDLEEEVLS